MEKKFYRASYGDESRVMIIIADSLQEAVDLANNNEQEREGDFFFCEESVFEIPTNGESQIVENFTFDSFV